MSNKHKHHDLIVAMAANTDLVKFHHDGLKWHKTTCDFTFHETHKYFLCLPQHWEACLHWLNGGDIEVRKLSGGDWQRMMKADLWAWSEHNNTMSAEWEFRIKPRKEKRMIVTDGNQICFVSSQTPYPASWQLIEIEVEVNQKENQS